MQQLSPLDASFLYAESARTPMHVSALQIYDPATAPGGRVTVEAIAENIRRRAARIPCFYQRLVGVPCQLDYPYWFASADFDPGRHVHHHVLPEPRDWSALCALTADLHSRLLKRDRPLWEMHVIEALDHVEDLPRGCYGVVTKLHHAAVDGIAGIGVTAALHDREPEPTEAACEVWKAEPRPCDHQLLARAGAHAWQQSQRWPGELPELARAAMGAPLGPGAPRTRFDRGVSRKRVFAASRFPFEAIHRLGAAVPRAKVNDVVLTVVGGALRRYLSSAGELPRRSLVALCPISVRAAEHDVSGGNRLSQMIVALHSDHADPLERLRAVRAETDRAKTRAREVDPGVLAALIPAPFAVFGSAFSTAAAARLFNSVVSDVPGPAQPLYSCGAKLVRVYGAGPLADGAGLFHTALSYAGDLTIATTSCPHMLPDPDTYHGYLRESFDELHRAVARA